VFFRCWPVIRNSPGPFFFLPPRLDVRWVPSFFQTLELRTCAATFFLVRGCCDLRTGLLLFLTCSFVPPLPVAGALRCILLFFSPLCNSHHGGNVLFFKAPPLGVQELSPCDLPYTPFCTAPPGPHFGDFNQSIPPPPFSFRLLYSRKAPLPGMKRLTDSKVSFGATPGSPPVDPKSRGYGLSVSEHTLCP